MLQARDLRNRVIATAVQWNDHPETTLGYAPPASAIATDCATLGLTGDACTADGRYFTADYPGILRQNIQGLYGGEVLYFNGALGVLTTPLHAQVWDVSPRSPLGNQFTPPAGAPVPGGGNDYTAPNFRRTVVIGNQLTLAVLRLLANATPLTDTHMTYAIQPFTTRLTNFGFRVLLVVDPATGRPSLGNDPGVLQVCPDAPKSYATCHSDNFAAAHDDVVDVDYRVGDHLQSAVEYLRIGPVGMMFLPGEMAGELVNGLPAKFRSEPQHWYRDDPTLSAYGAALTTPGFVKQRMHDKYEWTIGLGGDELGYVMPIVSFRVKCVADEFLPGTCAQLYASHDDRVPGRGRGFHVQDDHGEPGRARGQGRTHRVRRVRELQVRAGARPGQRPLRGDERGGLGPRHRHPRRGCGAHPRQRPDPGEPELPGLVAGLPAAGQPAVARRAKMRAWLASMFPKDLVATRR